VHVHGQAARRAFEHRHHCAHGRSPVQQKPDVCAGVHAHHRVQFPGPPCQTTRANPRHARSTSGCCVLERTSSTGQARFVLIRDAVDQRHGVRQNVGSDRVSNIIDGSSRTVGVCWCCNERVGLCSRAGPGITVLAVCTQSAAAFLVPMGAQSWMLLVENLESFGLSITKPNDSFVKHKRTACIKQLTSKATDHFKVCVVPHLFFVLCAVLFCFSLAFLWCAPCQDFPLTLRGLQARQWMNAAQCYTLVLQLCRRHDAKFTAICLSNRCACWLKVRAVGMGVLSLFALL